MFEVNYCETIRSSGTGVAAEPDGPGNVLEMEVCAPPDTAGVGF